MVITSLMLRTKSSTFAAALLILGVAAAGLLNSASAQQQKFSAKFSGSNEVPSVNTAGSGAADFQLSADGKSLDYQVNLTKMNSVMAVHIHSGKPGQTGDPVAGLFNPSMSGPQRTSYRPCQWSTNKGNYYICRSRRIIGRQTDV